MSDTPDEPVPPPVIQPPMFPAAPAGAMGGPPPVALPPAEPLNPWTAMFTRTRAVMRQILETNPSRGVHFLAIFGGIIEMLGTDLRPLMKIGLPHGPIIAMKVVCGALSGLFLLYVTSGLVRVTGRWLGGRGSFVDVRAATAWSNVPVFWSALLWLPLVGYLGMEAFNLDVDSMSNDPVGLLLLVPIGLAGFVLVIWRIVIYLKCVGEAHRFSAWRALGAAILASLLVGVPLGILAVTLVVGMGLLNT